MPGPAVDEAVVVSDEDPPVVADLLDQVEVEVAPDLAVGHVALLEVFELARLDGDELLALDPRGHRVAAEAGLDDLPVLKPASDLLVASHGLPVVPEDVPTVGRRQLIVEVVDHEVSGLGPGSTPELLAQSLVRVQPERVVVPAVGAALLDGRLVLPAIVDVHD